MKPDLSDLLIFLGVIAGAAGFYMIYPWALLAFVGVVMLLSGLILAIRSGGNAGNSS